MLFSGSPRARRPVTIDVFQLRVFSDVPIAAGQPNAAPQWLIATVSIAAAGEQPRDSEKGHDCAACAWSSRAAVASRLVARTRFCGLGGGDPVGLAMNERA